MEVPHQIPKIIHYCWFGKTSLPEDAQHKSGHLLQTMYAFML